MQKVKVIRRKNRAVLVEWIDKDGHLHRGTVPVESVDDNGKVTQDTLEMAIPAGFPWAELAEVATTPEEIERRLHQAGIWTLQDLLDKPNEALGAIQAAYKVDLARLTAKANQFIKNQQEAK